MKEEVLDIAVNWWANKIVHRNHDRRIDDPHIVELTEEQIEGFKEILRKEIIKCDKNYDYIGEDDILLHVDYDPCLALRIAMGENKISEMNIPVKITMYINKDYVTVYEGASCPEKQILYATEKYYLKQIEECEEIIKRKREEIQEKLKEIECHNLFIQIIKQSKVANS